MAHPIQEYEAVEKIIERKGPSLIAYNKLDEIGYGSFGVVYPYKLKNINSDHGPTEMAVKTIFRGKFIVRELRIALAVDHENVVKTFGVEETPDRIFIKMELAATDLSGLKSKVMKVEQFFLYEFYYLAHQILAGLAYLHSLNIAHRDVKPSNILVMVNEANAGPPPSLYSLTLKVCDFGASKIVPEKTELATIVGTREYMAPEVVLAYVRNEQHSHINYKRADVFSVGVVLHEMWYGKRPFTVDQLVKEEETNLVFNDLKNTFINDLLKNMLRWDRQQRCEADSVKLQLASSCTLKASEPKLEKYWLFNEEIEKIKWIIDSGADVNQVSDSEMTPLHYASSSGNISVAQLLIEAGADINRADVDGWIPLHHACVNGHLSVAQLLIEAGADVHRTDNEGWKPLHHACDNGHLSVAQLLIERGADINRTGMSGMAPLHNACGSGHLSVIQLLIDRGADINRTGMRGVTPLHHACVYGHLSVAQLLIEAGADVHKANNDGVTPLHFACVHNQLSVAQLLIEAGADVHRADNDGWIPLHFSCVHNQLSVAQLLIEAGTDVNRPSTRGMTPLHLACEDGNLLVAQLLIERGVDVNRADNNGKTPLHLAQEHHHSDLINLLCLNLVEDMSRTTS